MSRHKPRKVLFICKKNENYGYSTTGKRSGLFNSTRFVAEALCANGVEAQVVEVVDNNGIDREVAEFKPDIVVIEALWVVPEKFTQLKKLHPKVEWCIHLHSNAPFLAYEGISVQWITAYNKMGLSIIVNSPQAFHALEALIGEKNLFLLTNVYYGAHSGIKKEKKLCINVGCFGAIRPMKNQFTQALAAIKFAHEKGLHLNFFINAGRSETGGDPVLKNIKELFKNDDNGTLVLCSWLEHPDFMKLLRETIDLGLQVSLSETFNIVTADCVTAGVPVVTSSEVSWVSESCHASTDDVDNIVDCMKRVWKSELLVHTNKYLLGKYVKCSIRAWVRFVDGR